MLRIMPLVLCTCVLSAGQPQAAELGMGWLALEGDPRYRESDLEARYRGHPTGRPLEGARLAVRESLFVGNAIGIEFNLREREVRSAEALLPALRAMIADGSRFVLLDLPAAQVAELAAATVGEQLLLINVAAEEDHLRGEFCQRHLLHTLPNSAMRMDALAQFLVAKKWRGVLLLEGPTPEDQALSQSFQRSIKRFGLQLEDRRPFLLSNDPRQRDMANLALLTARGDYDVVFVADSDGEFARGVPFQINRPRPVVGAEGLVPLAWSWAWERHGAPQLNSRFRKRAKRDMTDRDWAAWAAVKALVEAALRTESADFEALVDYLRGTQIVIDGFKGNPMSFRPWDGQLRQPLLLTTHNWVAARAPMEGFLHARNNLDTLGFDERDSACPASRRVAR